MPDDRQQKNRRLITAAVVVALTIVGVAAGVKMQQESGEQKPVIHISIQPALKQDAAFFGTKAPSSSGSSASKGSAAQAPSKPAPVPAKPAVPADGIMAEAYVVGDLGTGKIYLEKNADEVLPFASMSKLITALVATNMYSADQPIPITEAEADTYPDTSGIHAGETYAASDILYPLLMCSSNIAANALASTTDPQQFMKLMSSYAWEIGMPHAYFADPSGLSELNAGTARGFFAMAKYLYASRKDILAITRIASTSMATTTDHDAHDLVNIHPFAGDPRFLGGKTGHTTAAEDTMLTILKLRDRPIAFVVLHSPGQRKEDTDRLVDKLLALPAFR